MVKITYIDADGGQHRVEAAPGLSLMEAALRGGVEAIEGECGGACACATCHVYVPENWQGITGTASADEIEMLECANDVDARSRLSCQIRLTAAMDGLAVSMPRSQR